MICAGDIWWSQCWPAAGISYAKSVIFGHVLYLGKLRQWPLTVELWYATRVLYFVYWVYCKLLCQEYSTNATLPQQLYLEDVFWFHQHMSTLFNIVILLSAILVSYLVSPDINSHNLSHWLLRPHHLPAAILMASHYQYLQRSTKDIDQTIYSHRKWTAL